MAQARPPQAVGWRARSSRNTIFTKRSSAEDGEAPVLRGRRRVPARERLLLPLVLLCASASVPTGLGGYPVNPAQVWVSGISPGRLPKVTNRKLWDAFRTCGSGDQQGMIR